MAWARLSIAKRRINDHPRTILKSAAMIGVKATGEGLRTYYRSQIEQMEIRIRDKQHNLRRLEAQRNDLNTKGGRMNAPDCICSALFN